MTEKNTQTIPAERYETVAFDGQRGSQALFSSLSASRRALRWASTEKTGNRFRVNLYRFLRDSIPLLNSCLWTWSRLCAAKGAFRIEHPRNESQDTRGREILERLGGLIYPNRVGGHFGIGSFLPMMFNSLFTDGAFAGFVILKGDGSGIERFVPVDPGDIDFVKNSTGKTGIVVETDKGKIKADGEDFYYIGLNDDISRSRGKSILESIPFVAYIQQQMIDDMRRTMHNAGYHRLHVKITPPERQSGEADERYVERINEYFDETVSMIRRTDPEDNPVTWDNVEIEYIGPGHTRTVSNSWFLSHRAMIEEICAGTNLSPFMLGYSFGTTHNWAQFKYDLVMRQVATVQRQASRFLEWLGNIELALRGFDSRCRFVFDNNFTYLAPERASIEKSRTETLISLYQSGLITREAAQEKAGELF